MSSMIADAGSRSETWCLQRFKITTPYQRQVVDMVREWADTFPERLAEGAGLVLGGPAGTGKDHLIFAAAAVVVLKFGPSAKWVACRDLFGAARDAMGNDDTERRLIREFTSPQLLILSDPLPPVGSLTPWQSDLLFRIVDARWRNQLCTCVTANVADDREADARLGAPVWDRMVDRSWRATTHWPSYRNATRTISPKG